MERNETTAFLLLLALLLAAMAAGYGVFYWYASGAKDIAGAYALYAVAAFAGVATFFSPCTFGLLPAYFSYYLTTRGAKPRRKGLGTALGFGLLAALGIVSFNAVLAVLLAFVGFGLGSAFSVAGGGALAGLTQGVRGVVGFLLVALGIAHFTHKGFASLLLHKLAEKFSAGGARERGTATGAFSFGFAYNVANIGCAGPLLAGVIILALASGVEATIAAFLVYSAAMAVLMIAATALIGAAEDYFTAFARATRSLQRISAVVLVLAGFLLLITALFPQLIRQFFP